MPMQSKAGIGGNRAAVEMHNRFIVVEQELRKTLQIENKALMLEFADLLELVYMYTKVPNEDQRAAVEDICEFVRGLAKNPKSED